MFRYEFDDAPVNPSAQPQPQVDSAQKAQVQAVAVDHKKTAYANAGLSLEGLAAQIVGQEQRVATPFGKRRVVYADFTASGRALTSIENYVQQRVLPVYGNTHTLTTATSRQTTFFRNEARSLVKYYLNCCPINDALIFCANGTTG